MDPEVEVKPTESGEEFYFVIKGGNGEVIATSETYTRAEDAQRGLDTVVVNVLRWAALRVEERASEQA